jgi:hypothetical protein
MGGAGSGNWYRFDKKTTTGECHSVDVRYLHREGLLASGRWFTLRWSRAGSETGSIRGAVIEEGKPERVVLTYRHRRGPGGEWEDVREPVPLTWTGCNFGGERPLVRLPRVRVAAGGSPSSTGRDATSCAAVATISPTRASEKRDVPGSSQGARPSERLGGSANMTEPFPERPKGMHHDTYCTSSGSTTKRRWRSSPV